jgi:hypothetical protein
VPSENVPRNKVEYDLLEATIFKLGILSKKLAVERLKLRAASARVGGGVNRKSEWRTLHQADVF